VTNSNIRGFYQANQGKFQELPFAVDTAQFCPIERQSAPKNIIFVGALDRAHAFKGLPVLMGAFKDFLGQGMRLRIVGDGDMKARYQGLAKHLGIQRETLFLGRLSLPGLVKEYQNAGITVLPSVDNNEAFGIVLIESLACGTPVIASDLPGVRCVFRPGINGYLVGINDAAALSRSIKEVFNDNDRWSLMSRAARGQALERYSLEAFRRGLGEVYKLVIGN
jgi:glycosyltransferase involved in cell wall biosynthesis